MVLMRLKWIIWLAPAALLLPGCTSSVQTSGTVATYAHAGYYGYYDYPFYDCYPSAIWYPYYSMYWNSFGDPYCYGHYYGPVYTCSWYYRNPWYLDSRPHYRNPHLVYGDQRDRHHDGHRDGYRDRPNRTDQPPVRQRRVLTPVSSSAPTRPLIANQQPVDSRHQTVRPQRPASSQPVRSRPASPPPARPPTPPPPPPSGSSYRNDQVATTGSSSSSSYQSSRSGSSSGSRSSSDSQTRSYSRERPAERERR